MRIVVDRDIPFIKGVFERYADVRYLKGEKIKKSDLTDADALIIRTRTRCDAALLERTAVKFIASATIGYDHIDTSFCEVNNIHWTNAEGCNSSSVQQYVAAALFHLSREFHFNLSEKTIGIVGVGNVGSKVPVLCEALGMCVLKNDPPRERREGSGEFVPLSTILEQSDIVTFHVPLNRTGADKTFHMINKELLASLKRPEYFINTSRGEIADTGAEKSALREKKLAGYVVDVWEHEPAIDPELLHMADIGTPHIAGYSADGKANGTAMSVRACSKFFGLGLDDWFPAQIPAPQKTSLDIDCRNLSPEEIAGAAVCLTYDILSDDKRLRDSPGTFEKQRTEYPLRREFPVYTVRLLHASTEAENLLRKLGFQIFIT